MHSDKLLKEYGFDRRQLNMEVRRQELAECEEMVAFRKEIAQEAADKMVEAMKAFKPTQEAVDGMILRGKALGEEINKLNEAGLYSWEFVLATQAVMYEAFYLQTNDKRKELIASRRAKVDNDKEFAHVCEQKDNFEKGCKSEVYKAFFDGMGIDQEVYNKT